MSRPWPCLERLDQRCLLSAGDLDLTFGTAGQVNLDVQFETTTPALVPLEGGQMLVVGVSRIRKIAADGTVDASFGAGGAIDAVTPVFRDVEILPGGKLLIATNQALARYHPNGQLDTTFLAKGWEWIPTLTDSLHAIYGIAIQPDGKILAHGQGMRSEFRIVRFTADGFLDDTFTPFEYRAQGNPVDPLVVQPDGKILFGGTNLQHEGRDFSLVRLLPDGGLDESFGDAGYWGGALEPRVDDFLLDDQGRILLTGVPALAVIGLTRLLPDGSVDPAFGTAPASTARHRTEVAFGPIEHGPIGSATQSPRVLLAPDGRIIAYDDFHLARFSPDGTFDPTFGRVTTVFLSKEYGIFMEGVIARPDGSLFVAGNNTSREGFGAEWNLYKLQPDDAPPGPITLDGATLSITGTDDADWIDVLATQNASAQFTHLIASVRNGFGRSFPLDEVSMIEISAGAGDDVVYLRSTAGRPSILHGGDGNDRLIGGEGRDSIWGNAGHDRIDGRGGADRLSGNGGRDKLSGGIGADRLYGGAGADWLAGQGGNDHLYGGAGQDLLTGGAGNDFLDARDGAGGAGERDFIVGNRGWDIALADEEDELVSIEELL